MTKLKKIIGLAGNKTPGRGTTILIYRKGSFEEINVYNGVITNRELTEEEYTSRLSELKKNPNSAFAGHPEIIESGRRYWKPSMEES